MIKISYNGKYPCLCSGKLVVEIDGKIWDFGDYCLESGGRVWFDKDWRDHVEEGRWNVHNWPEGFPVELKEAVIDAVNAEVPHGCCGGCV
jgi:hypothetical protein